MRGRYIFGIRPPHLIARHTIQFHIFCSRTTFPQGSAQGSSTTSQVIPLSIRVFPTEPDPDWWMEVKGVEEIKENAVD